MVEWKDKESFFEQGFDNRVFIIPAVIIVLIVAFASYKLFRSISGRQKARKEKAQKKKERKDQKKDQKKDPKKDQKKDPKKEQKKESKKKKNFD